MADIELKPCPFCGSKDIELRAGVVFNGAAHCKNCSADVVFDAVRMIAEGDYDWKTSVTNGWNNRAEDVVPRSEVDRLEKELAKCYEELDKSTDFYCSFTKSKIQNCPIQDEVEEAKQEVAREMLDEIKTKINSLIDFYCHHTTVLSTVRAKVDAYFEIDGFIAELEKKYIGEKK